MKKKIQKIVFDTRQNKPILFKEIKNIILDDDTIQSGYKFYKDTNDGYYYLIVLRWVEETDKEYNERIEEEKRDEEWAKEERYKRYLKLKKEFENNGK